MYRDVFKKIGEYLTNKEKIYSTATSKEMNKFKKIFVYHDKVAINVISELSYFDNFENVEIFDNFFKNIPKMAKYVHFKVTYSFVPPHVTHLIFKDYFDELFDYDIIPITVTHLTFGIKFGQPIGKLPVSVTHLTIDRFLYDLTNKLPASITHLTFGRNFDSPIELPPFVTHLKFGSSFDRQIKLPSTVTHLKFGYHFDQPIKLPSTVTHLKFGKYFDQPIKLPQSIIRLTFGACFNQPINLPSSITHLVLGYHFHQPTLYIPPSLTHLTYYEDKDNIKKFNQKINDNVAVKIILI